MVEALRGSVETGEEDLQEVFSSELEQIPSRKPIEGRIARQEELESQLPAFMRQRAFPAGERLGKAAGRFHKSYAKHAQACYGAHTEAADQLVAGGDSDGAKRLLGARDAQVTSSPDWLSEIPDYVDVHIAALCSASTPLHRQLHRYSPG